jgi:uncharacterized protein YutE (UPF0331/DUF86 family)
MTRSSLEIQELRRIRTVAQEYRDKGYEVIVHPQKTELPPFIADFHIDLLAQNGDDHAIVEVKTRTSLAKDKDLVRLAEVLQDRLGWRLELVVTNPKQGPDDSYLAQEATQILSAEEVEERFRQVEDLLEQKYSLTAMLLAWTATEAALRLIAERQQVRLKEQSPAYIVKQLFSVGVLDTKQYDTLYEAVRFRNTIVHGFRINQIQPAVVRNLIGIATDLLQSTSLVRVHSR